MSYFAITTENLTKKFFLPHERRDTLKEHIFHVFKSQTYEMLKAVNAVSFKVKKGEFVGIIGRNGSGKSTLLKLLSGILVPSLGEINVSGAISPFLELGVGFQPDLSGRDNVFLYGALLGFSRRRIKERYKSIVEFAELEKFMDQKIKNYSSGMQVRLAFSVTVHTLKDILLVDEALAVGDAIFQERCKSVFKRIKSGGKTTILVSHDLAVMKEFCNRILCMENGKIIRDGNPRDVIDFYLRRSKEE